MVRFESFLITAMSGDVRAMNGQYFSSSVQKPLVVAPDDLEPRIGPAWPGMQQAALTSSAAQIITLGAQGEEPEQMIGTNKSHDNF